MLEWWSRKSILAKIVIVIVAACALLIATGSIRSCVIHSRDERFDRQEREHAEERDALQAEKERAIGRATAAEAVAKELEAKARVAELAVQAAGQRAEAIQEKIRAEDEKLSAEMTEVEKDIDAAERCRRLCERAKRLKLLSASTNCGC